MGAKYRPPSKPKKSKKTGIDALETVDDFQEAADAEEAAGGKWRAGDKAKSCRAFLRAIDIYNAGLQRYPHSFELAYNRAHIQLDMSQQPALVAELPMSEADFLQQTLQSHRYALRINEEDVDILYNTAQVLTTIAERSDLYHGANDAHRITLFQEALEMLDACYARQEMLFDEQRQLEQEASCAATSFVDGRKSPSPSGELFMSEQSAVVQAAVTPRDLLDTAYSSLFIIKELLELVPAEQIAAMDKLAAILLDQRIAFCIGLLPLDARSDAQRRLLIERALSTLAVADADFRNGRIEAETYVTLLGDFTNVSATDADEFMARADAITMFLKSFYSLGSIDLVKADRLHGFYTNAKHSYASAMQTLQSTTSATQATTPMTVSLSARSIDDVTRARLGLLKSSQADLDVLFACYEAQAVARGAAYVQGTEPNGPIMLLDAAYKYYEESSRDYSSAGDAQQADQQHARAAVTKAMNAILQKDEAALAIVKASLAHLGTLGHAALKAMHDEELLPFNVAQGLG